MKHRSRPHRTVLVPLLALALSAPTTADAAPPPTNRTYFTVTMGLEGKYDLGALCLDFSANGLMDFDGELSGTWQRERPKGKKAAFAFALSIPGDGESVAIEGDARVDARGAGSSIGGTGLARQGAEKLNYAFAGREVSPAACRALVAEFEGDSESDEPVPDLDVVGSGSLATESRPVAGFDAVSIDDVGSLVIEQTGSESLTITAEDNILPLITSRVRDGRLELGIGSTGDVRPTREITYLLTVRSLDDVQASGAVEVEATGIESDRLELDLRGSVSVHMAGDAEHQVLRISGSASYLADALDTNSAEVDLSGSSHTLVRVRDSIEGTAAGSSSLEYIGSPTVDVSTSGTASVRRVGG